MAKEMGIEKNSSEDVVEVVDGPTTPMNDGDARLSNENRKNPHKWIQVRVNKHQRRSIYTRGDSGKTKKEV